MNDDLLKAIEVKYKKQGENPDTYLQGLLHAKPITYWDYIGVETLLSLQHTRTDFRDEPIFIMYHQVTELVLKMLLHELTALVEVAEITESEIQLRVSRMNRYTSMLIQTFDIMSEGMDYDQYNQFRMSLAPASGFQSAQFRFVEFYATGLENLINAAGKARLPENPGIMDLMEQLYWKDAGTCRHSGHQSVTLGQFEKKYKAQFVELATEFRGKTLEDKIMSMNLSKESKDVLREFDYLYNVEWPMVHLNTAKHYLDSKGENKAATGGSEWKKYLHPEHQQRKFFPGLWSEIEIANWGKEEVM